MRELLVPEAVRFVATEALALAAAPLVDLKVALADVHVAIPLKGDDMRGESVQKPAIVGDDDDRAGKVGDPLFQRP